MKQCRSHFPQTLKNNIKPWLLKLKCLKRGPMVNALGHEMISHIASKIKLNSDIQI